MARVLLVDPRGWQGAVNGYAPSPNIGIAYLVPMLCKHGHEVSVIDLNNEAMTDAQVMAIIDVYQPEIVGFSAKTATMKDARNLAQKIKGLLPKVAIVLGGPHTKLAWRSLIAEPWFDVVFVGEGENVLPTLCHRLMTGSSVEELPGILTKRNLTDASCVHGPLVNSAELVALPYPEYDLFPQNVRESLRTSYPLVTSRGCVYECTFCSVPEISGSGFRKRSPENVIDELEWSRERYGTTSFWIVDDVFNLNMKRCKEICRAIIDAGLGMTWSCPNGLRADRVDRELAELMFEAGCRNVNVGVESVTPQILATIKKGETAEDIERGIGIFQEAGVRVTGFFIIGLPGDSFEAQERSVEFVKRMGIGAHFNLLVPYPGTELWQWAKKNVRFLEDIEDGIHFRTDPKKIKVVIETDDFPASERLRAYEAVHTRIGQFDMLIPPNLPRWQHRWRMLYLLWNYDSRRLPGLVFRQLVGALRALRGQLTGLAGKALKGPSYDRNNKPA